MSARTLHCGRHVYNLANAETNVVLAASLATNLRIVFQRVRKICESWTATDRRARAAEGERRLAELAHLLAPSLSLPDLSACKAFGEADLERVAECRILQRADTLLAHLNRQVFEESPVSNWHRVGAIHGTSKRSQRTGLLIHWATVQFAS